MGGWIAHKNQKDERIQTLEDHCAHVASLSSSFLAKIDMEEFGDLVGKLHDMGKACQPFVKHIMEQNHDLIDHASVGAQYLDQNVVNHNDLLSTLTFQYLAMAIMSHHTGMEDFVDYNGTSKFLQRLSKEIDTYEESVHAFLNEIYKEDTLKKQFHLCEKEIDQLLKNITSRYVNTPNEHEMQFFELSLFGRYLFSALIDADRKDSADFEDGVVFDKKRESPKWDRYYENVMEHNAHFHCDSKINQLRKEIAEQCDQAGTKPQGIYELNVPTGGGKTLSSLRFALNHAMTHKNIEHIYYIIPYNTILNQNAKTIQSILFKEDHPPKEEFLLHNSTVVSGNDGEDEEIYDKYTERWNSKIIMTTTVQFLNTLFLGTKKDARRMHQLSNSIIILDEVQCLPVKVLNMFNTAMNFLHHVCHSTVLLCTATQPHLHEVEKPILLSNTPSLVDHYSDYYQAFKRVDLIQRYRTSGYTINELVQETLPIASSAESTLIVMNTKLQAKQMYDSLRQEMPDSYEIFHLSTSMCVKHRQDILQKVIEKLEHKEPIVLISTNLIEAGVDISFSTVIRAMAGMDAIVQCAGRCNRHGENKDKLGKIYVYNIADSDENLNRLEDIKMKKQCTKELFMDFERYPDKFEHDLMSLKAMDRFYQIYHHHLAQIENLLDYNLSNGKTSIYELLSKNRQGIYHYASHGKQFPYQLAFAYRQAGEAFCVIDHVSKDIIVPYGEGKRMISDLLSHKQEPDVIKKLLREAQNYTVSLYDYQIKQLNNQAYFDPDLGVRYLAESNYDENLGVVLDGMCLGLLI